MRLAALASLGAGVIHIAVTPDHYATWWLSGIFFLTLSLFQIGWGAALVLQPGRALSTAASARVWWLSAIAVNTGSIVLWALTRSVVGEPFGPNAGTPLPLGPAGVISSLLEAGLVIAMLAAVRARPEKSLIMGVPLLVAATLVLGGASAYGVSAGLSHDHAGHTDGEGHLDEGHDDEETEHDEDPTHHEPPSAVDPSGSVEPEATTRPSPATKADPDTEVSTGDEGVTEPAHDDGDDHGH